MEHRLLESLLGRLPIDDVPDCVEVFGFTVLILKTITCQRLSPLWTVGNILVSVFPRIYTQERPELPNNRVLILKRSLANYSHFS